jgi:hypothetical protein
MACRVRPSVVMRLPPSASIPSSLLHEIHEAVVVGSKSRHETSSLTTKPNGCALSSFRILWVMSFVVFGAGAAVVQRLAVEPKQVVRPPDDDEIADLLSDSD